MVLKVNVTWALHGVERIRCTKPRPQSPVSRYKPWAGVYYQQVCVLHEYCRVGVKMSQLTYIRRPWLCFQPSFTSFNFQEICFLSVATAKPGASREPKSYTSNEEIRLMKKHVLTDKHRVDFVVTVNTFKMCPNEFPSHGNTFIADNFAGDVNWQGRLDSTPVWLMSH